MKNAFTYIQNGNIEGTAAQVIHGDDLVLFLVQTVCQRGCGRFVDDAQYFQTGNAAGIFGGVTLGVIKICGHGDDSLGDSLAQKGFGIRFEFAEDHGAHFGGAVFLAIQHHTYVAVGGGSNFIRHTADGALHFSIVEFASHETFDRKYCVLGVDNSLVAGGATHHAFVILVHCHHGGDESFAFRRGDDNRFAAGHDCNNRVGGAEINTYDFSHNFVSYRATRTIAGRKIRSPSL